MKFIPVILDIKDGEIKRAKLDKNAFYTMKIVDVIQVGNDVVQVLQLKGESNEGT